MTTVVRVTRVARALVVMACLLAACTDSGDEPFVAEAPDAEVQSPPPSEDDSVETMVLDPVNPSVGGAFTAEFSADNLRGGYFHLFRWDGSTWGPPRYQLESDANGGEPTAISATDGLEVDDYGVEGRGPDRLVMPDDLAEGFWRICTANALDLACAQFTVS